MQIEVSSHNDIPGGETLIAHVRTVVEHALSHVSEHVTRVEVHLSDANREKGGLDNKHCMMEARLEGLLPTAVTDQAETMELAIHGAANKLKTVVASTLEKIRDKR